MANLKEVFDNGKFFQLVEGGPKYYIIPPKAEEIKSAEWHYSKIYNKAFMADVTTVAEMRDALRKRGLLGEDFDKKLAEISLSIQEAISEMESTEDKDKKRDLAIKVAQLRNEALAWNQRASSPMNQTCEALAEDAKMEFLASCMIVNEDGSKVWKEYQSYVEEENRELFDRSKYECIMYWNNIDPDFISKFPENVVLQELADEEIKAMEEKADEVVDKEAVVDGEVEEEEKEQVREEVEEKPKKKKLKK